MLTVNRGVSNVLKTLAIAVLFATIYALVIIPKAEAASVGSCEMVIYSEVNDWSNKAEATGPCAGLVYGSYFAGGDGLEPAFSIEGSGNYRVDYNGQEFIIGTPAHTYPESILKVYTVIGDKSVAPVKFVAGWFEDGGITYYYKADGTKATGFNTIDNKKYYFYSTGGMAKGWLKLSGDRTFYLKIDGTMATGFNTIDNNRYYFYSTGGMSKGWLSLPGNRTYYFTEDGTAAKGFNTIDNKKYYFYSTGGLAKGWLNLPGGRTYYLNSDGTMQTGWMTLNGDTYYFYSTGGMVRGALELPGGRSYYFDSNGVLQP